MEYLKYEDVLKKCPLFEGIDFDDLRRMLICLGAWICKYEKKQTIIPEGSSARNIGVVLYGEAQISRIDYYGNRSIIDNVSEAGIFAEDFACAAVDQLPVTITASEACEIMFIDCDHVMHTCNNHCAFHGRLIYNLARALAVKNISFHRRVAVTSCRTTREKLMAYLMYCSRDAGSRSFDVPFDRQELADYLEVDRSGLSAEISKLRCEGVLESRKNHFHLL